MNERSHEDLCREHAERLRGLETSIGTQKETLERIEQKLDSSLKRTTRLEKDMSLAKWLGGVASAMGLTAISAWIGKLMS